MHGEWFLHPAVVDQLWAWLGQASVDLFASREIAQCALFSLRSADASMAMLAARAALDISHPGPDSSHSAQSEGGQPLVDINSSALAC